MHIYEYSRLSLTQHPKEPRLKGAALTDVPYYRLFYNFEVKIHKKRAILSLVANFLHISDITRDYVPHYPGAALTRVYCI